MSLNYRSPRPTGWLKRLFFPDKTPRRVPGVPFFRPSTESLEPRTVLSTLAGDLSTSVEMEATESGTIEVSSLEANASIDDSDAFLDIAQELVAADIGLVSGSVVAVEPIAVSVADSTTGTITPSLLMWGAIAPKIVEFSCSLQAGWLTFQGRVVDNQDPTGLKVYFTGVYGTHISTVDADDWFEWQIAYDPYIHGTVSCMTMDADFNLSNMASVYV